jgi:hypothetical protein
MMRRKPLVNARRLPGEFICARGWVRDSRANDSGKGDKSSSRRRNEISSVACGTLEFLHSRGGAVASGTGDELVLVPGRELKRLEAERLVTGVRLVALSLGVSAFEDANVQSVQNLISLKNP